MSRRIPVLWINKEDCCACTACVATCPHKAIIMKMDVEGFFYPQIQEEKCVACYRCISVCPLSKKEV